MTYNSAMKLLHDLLTLEMRTSDTERLGDLSQVTQLEREGMKGVNLNSLLQGPLCWTVSREMGTEVAQKERMFPLPRISPGKWGRKAASKDAHVLIPRRGEYTTLRGKVALQVFKDPEVGRTSGLPGRAQCITRGCIQGEKGR